MVGDDYSLTGGVVSAGTLLILAYAVSYACWASKRVSRLVEGTPQILVRHGSRNAEVMDRQQVSIPELVEAMRRAGCANITDVQTAILENDGKISVIRRSGPKR
jgi:uncharacterized membrane protein YcaP (DUF421 family)